MRSCMQRNAVLFSCSLQRRARMRAGGELQASWTTGLGVDCGARFARLASSWWYMASRVGSNSAVRDKLSQEAIIHDVWMTCLPKILAALGSSCCLASFGQNGRCFVLGRDGTWGLSVSGSCCSFGRRRGRGTHVRDSNRHWGSSLRGNLCRAGCLSAGCLSNGSRCRCTRTWVLSPQCALTICWPCNSRL